MKSPIKIVYVRLRHIATGNVYIEPIRVPSGFTMEEALIHARDWGFSDLHYAVESVSKNRWDGLFERMNAAKQQEVARG